LRAQVRRRFGPAVAESARPVPFAAGVALVAAGPEGERLAAVFAEAATALGSAIDTAHREGAEHLYFFAELNTTETARRATAFSLATTVIDPDADFQGFQPAPSPAAEPVPAALAPVAERLASSGLDIVWEHGVLSGEWLGLEVARATLDQSGAVVDVGVGRHDREAHRLVHPEGPTDESLAEAVRVVVELRRPGARAHPANRLVPERWLRAVLIRHPGLVGLSALQAAPAPSARDGLRQRGIAPAWALDADGRPTVVVCSVGVDPDLVPAAADARLQAPSWPGVPDHARTGPDAWRLVLAVPEGDDHPLNRRLVALLRRPAELVTVPAGWRFLGA